MGLNIKDPEVYRLAQAISLATGESMTRVVKDALQDRFARLERAKGRASVDELLAIADRAAASVKGSHVEHGEFLYDEHGLPR